MKRGTYDNSYNRNRRRIDGRPQSSWATQAGLRGVHRDTRGNVIGGFTDDGQGWGNKVRGPRPAAAPAAPTQAAPPTAAPAPVQTTVSTTPPAKPPAAPAMPKAAPAPAPVSKINGMPASQAIAQARVGANAAWQGKVKAPTFSAATATANLASKGLDGAVADYHARSAKAAGQAFAKAANAPGTKPAATWQQATLGKTKPPSATAPVPATPMTVGGNTMPADYGRKRPQKI